MSPDGLRVEDSGTVIIDANRLPGYSTLEGPKFYKRNGYQYIFARAGGDTETKVGHYVDIDSIRFYRPR